MSSKGKTCNISRLDKYKKIMRKDHKHQGSHYYFVFVHARDMGGFAISRMDKYKIIMRKDLMS